MVQRLALGLAARGHQVRVACLMTGGGISDELQAAGIPVISLEADRRGWARRRHWSLLRLAARACRRAAYVSLSLESARPRHRRDRARADAYRQRAQCRIWKKAAWRVWVDRLTWRLARLWTANSREVARVLEEREGVDARRIDMIPNGIDTAHFAESVRERRVISLAHGLSQPGDRVVICVGRLDPLKGQATLRAAFRDVTRKEPRARLCLVGEGVVPGSAGASSRGIVHAVLIPYVRWNPAPTSGRRSPPPSSSFFLPMKKVCRAA